MKPTGQQLRVTLHELALPLRNLRGRVTQAFDIEHDDPSGVERILKGLETGRWNPPVVGSVCAELICDALLYEMLVRNLAAQFSVSFAFADIPKKFELLPVLTEAIRVVRPTAARRGVEIRWDPPLSNDVALEISGHRADVARLFLNLLDNAIKYSFSPAGADQSRFVGVKVYRSSMEGDLTVSIDNYGVPVDEDEISSGLLFQPGYRGRHAHDRDRLGSGLGLAEVHRIAREHHAHLDVRSEPKPGGAHLVTVKVTFRALAEGRR